MTSIGDRARSSEEGEKHHESYDSENCGFRKFPPSQSQMITAIPTSQPYLATSRLSCSPIYRRIVVGTSSSVQESHGHVPLIGNLKRGQPKQKSNRRRQQQLRFPRFDDHRRTTGGSATSDFKAPQNCCDLHSFGSQCRGGSGETQLNLRLDNSHSAGFRQPRDPNLV